MRLMFLTFCFLLLVVMCPLHSWAFRVFPTIAQTEEMLDKSNFPFIAENVDGINLPYDAFGPFSAGQVETLFNMFKNKNFINHGVYKEGVPITSMSTMNKKPSFANVTAMMLYNEAPAMDSIEWASALQQECPWPLITHCRAFGHTNAFKELKRQILVTSGCMFEFQVTNPDKYVDAAELAKFCVDNNKMVVFLTTFQQTPDIFSAAYQSFFYYLKEHLGPDYLSSDLVIFAPNTYNDNQVLPETSGYGSTFGIAHWLIEQKDKIDNGYIQPKINFVGLKNNDFFANHTNLTVKLNVESQLPITKAELYVNGVSAGERTNSSFSWSGGILDNLTTGLKNLKVVVTEQNGQKSFAAIQIKILKDPPVVPGFFKAADLADYQLRNTPLENGEIRHVYGGEWIDYKLMVKHTGIYDVRIGLGVQRSKQYGGTIILQKGGVELGRFTTVLNDPDKAALPGFTEHPKVEITNIFLEEGEQVIRVTFQHPEGRIVPQFRLNDFTFMIQGAPEITITHPLRNEAGEFNVYNAPATIVVGASIVSPRAGGLVKMAELFVNGKSAAKLTSMPFLWNDLGEIALLSNLSAGTYRLKIEATDELGYTSFKEITLNVVERRSYRPDLKIPGVVKAIEFDLGGEGVAYHDFNEGVERGLGGNDNPRYSVAGSEDVEIEQSAGDYCVSAIRHGEWLNYTFSDMEKGTYEIILTTASNAGKSADVNVWLDGKILATVPITQTASVGFTEFKEFSVSGIVIPESRKNVTIRLEFVNRAIRNYLCFFRKFEFRKQEDIGIPSVGFVFPEADTMLTTGYSSFSVKAEAVVGTDFYIKHVRLFVDDVVISELANPPYLWQDGNLVGLSPGKHTLKIVATASTGLTAVQERQVIVYDPRLIPEIISIEPANGAEVDASQHIAVEVVARDPDDDLKAITLFMNGNSCGAKNEAPYRWSGMEDQLLEGRNELKVLVVNHKGYQVDSTWVINATNVRSPITMSLIKPLVTGEIQVEPAYSLDVDVAAESSVGSISRVTLYIDDREIRTERVAPYTWGHSSSPDPNELNGLSEGLHELKFVAEDDRGNRNELLVYLRVGISTSIDEVFVMSEPVIYPNPVSNFFILNLPLSEVSDVVMMNEQGDIVWCARELKGKVLVKRDAAMKPGCYYVRIKTNQVGIRYQKLIIL